MMDAVDVLLEARAYIGKGWCQHKTAAGERYMATGDLSQAEQVCLWGSLYRVSQEHHLGYTVTKGALGLVQQAIGVGYGGPIAWNDAPGRTQSEVEDAFDRAIILGLDEQAAALRGAK